VNGAASVEDVRWPIVRIGVCERTDTSIGVVEVLGEITQLPVVAIVTTEHRQANAVAGRYDDAGRPDLDVHLIDLTGDERVDPSVSVIRPIRQTPFLIQLPM
jgi:hypothetical protein